MELLQFVIYKNTTPFKNTGWISCITCPRQRSEVIHSAHCYNSANGVSKLVRIDIELDRISEEFLFNVASFTVI